MRPADDARTTRAIVDVAELSGIAVHDRVIVERVRKRPIADRRHVRSRATRRDPSRPAALRRDC